MHLRVPHGYQPNVYTCGPKSLWMVLRYFKKRVPLAQLELLCKTTEKTGTNRKMMKHTMRKLGFKVHSKYNASLRDIRSWINKGIPVIVDFRDWKDNITHDAVIIGITKTRIVFNDPIYGAHISVSHRAFRDRWYGKYHTKYTRWMMVAQPKKESQEKNRPVHD